MLLNDVCLFTLLALSFSKLGDLSDDADLTNTILTAFIKYGPGSPSGRTMITGKKHTFHGVNICCAPWGPGHLLAQSSEYWQAGHQSHSPGVPRTAGGCWLRHPLWLEGCGVGPTRTPRKALLSI